MALSEVEILALIFSAGIVLKLIFLCFSKSYAGYVQKIYKNLKFLIVAEAVLAGLVLYYLLQQMTIVQIVACLLLGALLTGLTFAVYAKELMPTVLKILKKKDSVKKAWLPMIIWLGLAGWALYKIFY